MYVCMYRFIKYFYNIFIIIIVVVIVVINLSFQLVCEVPF